LQNLTVDRGRSVMRDDPDAAVLELRMAAEPSVSSVRGMFYMHDIGWGWWLLMSVGMVAFWALVVYGIVFVARGGWRDRIEPPPQEGPDDILRRRLAQGEISIEEYERLHDALHPRARDKAAA
jgi:putative membrane protein